MTLPRDAFASEPEWALSCLRDLLADLQEGLEIGDFRASDYFGAKTRRALPGEAADEDGNASEEWAFDVTHYNTTLRYHTKRVLEDRQRVVEEASLYEVQDAANLGIHLRHGPFRVRVRKSSDLEPPVPGDSMATRAFYRQEVLVPDDRNVINLLALWRISSSGTVELRLVKPLDGAGVRASVQIEWGILVPDLAHDRVARQARDVVTSQPTGTVEDLDTIRPVADQDEARRKGHDQG